MKMILFRYAGLLILILTSSCDKSALDKYLPTVHIKGEPIVMDHSAIFKAEMKNKTSERIVEYGFIWGDNDAPYYYHRVALSGDFLVEIDYALKAGVDYKVLAYLKTENTEIYSTHKTFTSRGSLPPEVSNFSPEKPWKNDTLILEGARLGGSDYQCKVRLAFNSGSSRSFTRILSVTPTRIVAVIPSTSRFDIYPGKVQILLKVDWCDEMVVGEFDN